jgi:hypothetical protein
MEGASSGLLRCIGCWVAAVPISVGMALAADPPSMTALPALHPLIESGSTPPPPWRIEGLPGQRKPYTRFDIAVVDGERVLRVEADHAYGNLVHATQLGPGGPHLLSWRWRVEEHPAQADLRQRDAEDMPLRVCALFDMPLASVPFLERQLLRAMRLKAQEPLPAASVCYVWDSRLPPGTVLSSPYTRRIRYVVMHGPESPLHAWRHEQRDIHADFLLLFGNESATVPPLMAVLVGADTDNTQSHSLAHLAALDLH